MDEELKKYRQSLLDTLRFLNESYDKLLVTLSGGALALSITFLKDVINLKSVIHSELLFLSWLAFILSLASVLGRVMLGIEANRKAIEQVDAGTIYEQKAGELYSKFTRYCHMAAAAFLLAGLLCIAVFTKLNVGG